MEIAANQVPQDDPNPHQWNSMEDLLQQAELSGLNEAEIDQLGFATFCQYHQLWGSFPARREVVRNKVQEFHHTLNNHSILQQPATGTIAPFLSETEYNAFPEIEVTNTEDIGPGSLREAIAKAETMNGSRIVFKLRPDVGNYNPQTGVWTIEMRSILYVRASRTLIDGFSQARFGGETNPNGPEIMILSGTTTKGSLSTDQGSLFISSIWYLFSTSQTWVRGFNFNSPREQARQALGAIGIGHTSGTGNGYASGNKITDCWIGLNSDGESVFSEWGDWAITFDQGTRNNLIENNLITYLSFPIYFFGTNNPSTAIGNTIRGNYIGTNKSGTKRLQNFRSFTGVSGGTAPTAITFRNGSRENIFEDNIIAGSQSGGIGSFNHFDQDASGGNIIRRNRVGVGVNGENIAPVVPPDNVPTLNQDNGAFAIGISGAQNDIIEDNIVGNFKLGGIKVQNWAGTTTTQTTRVANNRIFNTNFGVQIVGTRFRTEVVGNQLENCRSGVTVSEVPFDVQIGYHGNLRKRTYETRNVNIQQNTFTTVSNPLIALVEDAKTVSDGLWQPNTATSRQPRETNELLPTPRLTSAIRQTDGTILIEGSAVEPGMLEVYSQGMPLAQLPIAAGQTSRFTLSLPASVGNGKTTLAAALISGATSETSEVSSAIPITNVPPPDDQVVPTVTVTSPATGLVVESRPNAQVAVIWQSSDNVGVTGHWIKLNATRNGTPFEETLAAGLPGTATSFTLRRKRCLFPGSAHHFGDGCRLQCRQWPIRHFFGGCSAAARFSQAHGFPSHPLQSQSQTQERPERDHFLALNR
ncbi:MAG: right-handed parallel beta-helix repeat-containing protein [Acidobacteria bacterium]|nr:right-handed parallel beta-helix repeat-containing protein [Acidobacteriota bacterium]